MIRRRLVFGCLVPLLSGLGGLAGLPAVAAAQEPASRLWITAGAASGTLRGDCQECEAEFPYRHSLAITGNAGYRVTPRMDVGVDIFWMPVDTSQGRIRTTHIDAVAQFRPWSGSGFFIKGGAGMAFVRNWLDAVGPGAINSKALSVLVGGGWTFRPDARVGLQVSATQHVAAIGDLQTVANPIPDVTGNFWSIGAAIVIR